MATLQDLINLTRGEDGKIFVVDESGEVKLVILSPQDYEKLLARKLVQVAAEAEKINREIIQAQLQEDKPAPLREEGESHIRHALGKRAEELFRARPYPPSPPTRRMAPALDLRSEVIDPSFNFDAPASQQEEF